jgi:choline dehydrogenase-like flavoprotein
MVETPKYKTTDAVDFVIVGSGAAGGVLAKELSSNGFHVVVRPLVTTGSSNRTHSAEPRRNLQKQSQLSGMAV